MQTMGNKSQQSKSEMIDNVKQSTSSALQALQFFHRSLVQARLPQSIQSYRTMCDTLVGQRIWMLDKESPEVLKNFEELSQIAQSINEILSPYVSHLDKLVELGASNQNTQVELTSEEDIEKFYSQLEESQPISEQQAGSNEKSFDTTAEKILAILEKNRKKASFTKIRSELRLKRSEVKLVLDRMVSNGEILCKSIGGRDMYEQLST